jgi:glycosyltransferase involved in cell wall biosynthesis
LPAPKAAGDGVTLASVPSTGRPRILLVVTLAEVGGAQSYVANLLPALVDDYDVAVAAWGPGPLRDAAGAAGAAYVELRHVRRAVSPRHDPLGILELTRLFRRLRPDIVHLNSSKAGVLGRLAASAARVPVRVFTAHGWGFKAFDGPARRAYLWADRLVRPLTTAFVCVSRSDLELGLRAGTCTAARTVVIPNAVDTRAFGPSHGSADDTLRVVSVGRLKAPKDFVTLVRAVACADDVPMRLTIVGDGPDRPVVEREIEACGVADRVVVAGESRDVPGLLAGADVLVLSSSSEGMPVTLLEAMAASLPVVATAVGGVPEVVVSEETGLLVGAGDPDALAAALRRLAGDPELRRRLGDAGRRRVEERFSIARWRADHLALYQRLLAARRRSSSGVRSTA